MDEVILSLELEGFELGTPIEYCSICLRTWIDSGNNSPCSNCGNKTNSFEYTWEIREYIENHGVVNRLIIDLECVSTVRALNIAKITKGKVWGYKINRQIFSDGINIIEKFKKYGNVMTDFRFYDTPNAVEDFVGMMVAYGSDITTVHIASCCELPDNLVEHVASIINFTSRNGEHCKYNLKPRMIESMIKDVRDCSYGYIVCSSSDLDREVLNVTDLNYIVKITSTIKPSWSKDKNKLITPKKAIDNGSDLILVDRHFFKDKDIIEAIDLTNEEITKSLDEL